MESIGVVLIAIIILLTIGIISYIIGIFNGLVSLKNSIHKAWSNIDVLLKQRYDELPNLIETVKGYMAHEKEVLMEITKARSALMSASSKEDKAKINENIGRNLKTIFAVAENYPKLQANQNFLKLQERISSLENEIADRRELYNDSVMMYNTRIESFPDMMIAKIFKYQREQPFSAIDDEKKNIKVEI